MRKTAWGVFACLLLTASCMFASALPAYAAGPSAKLTGVNYAIFNKLKGEIALVADGSKTSTVFELALNELGLDQTEWTAEELGVPAIVENGAITDEACNALSNRLGIDLNAINRALLADCPYETYWYDKKGGIAISGPSMAASYSYGSGWKLRLAGGATVSLKVTQDWAAGEYQVDTTNIERVHHAVAKAASIVEENAGKSDIDKLIAYREAICGLVAYNQAAADDDTTPYGDPWQLIPVFDEDDSTNSVCEGYSKAFQYLCDLTDFEGDVSCICVSGMMTGGTGEGPHMWNIVTMEDGKHYLVDVTDCDEGTIGAPDQLFLVGYESGDATMGYTYLCEGGPVAYAYDSETLSDYDDELAVSGERYTPGIPDPAIVWGDANGDGSINSADALLVLRYSAGKIGVDEIMLDNCDVDGNGSVNSLDALLILQYSAQKIDRFPADA